MKTRLILCLIALTSISGFSQSFKKVKVGVGFGFPSYFLPTLLYVEPGYRINDRWLLTSRIETAFVLTTQNQFTTNSGALIGQYYFSTNKNTRFFVGAGIGWFSLHRYGQSCDCSIKIEKDNVGVTPRFGFDIKHFNLTLDYNILPRVEQTTTSLNPGPTGYSSISYYNSSFLSLKIGVSIGGGKKKKN